jgi:NAD(P)-dependent dehydrogenase (short-subunit alcohol dehydrogenase family)
LSREERQLAKAQSRLILITGATRGLGRAMADRFIALGHTVAGCGRSTEQVKAMWQRHGAPHRFDILDVSDDAAVRSWADSVLASHGPPDLVLNNAALINANAPLWELTSAQFDPVIDVNIKGVVNVIRHFVPAMIRRGSGAVVNFSSGWGRSTSPEVAPYCATKWAIEGLTRALAQELPDGLAAVPLNPGIIDTDMLRSCFGGSAAEYPSPARWAEKAVPFLLQLGPKDNSKPLSAPH